MIDPELILFIIIVLPFFVLICAGLVNVYKENKENKEIFAQLCAVDLEKEEKIEKAKKTLLAELYQQKQEIEKQIFKEDEYNFCVAQQIIETMCLERLRKEYSDHFYMVYKKVLEDIETLKDPFSDFKLLLEEYYGENFVDNIYKKSV